MHFPTSQVLNCNCIAFLITESWQQTEPWHSQTGFFLPLFASFTFWFISIFRKLLNISQTPPCFIKKKKSFHWTKVISGSARSAFSFSHTPNFFARTMNFVIPNMSKCFPHNSRPQNTSLQWAFKSTLSTVCMWLPALRGFRCCICLNLCC